jgi:hypothetical protein
MSITGKASGRGPAGICSVDESMAERIADPKACVSVILYSCAAILIGSTAYGAVFGIWRCPLQAAYAAIKMPVLIFSVTLASAVINTMLAQVMGTRMSFRQVCACMCVAFAVASLLLGSFAPVVLFFLIQSPASDSPEAMITYRVLLATHTAVVAVCGILGNIKLCELLNVLTGSQTKAVRVFLVWFVIAGLVGCQLSWLISPFLATPGVPLPFFNPNAFKTNFFEYLFQAMLSGGR